MTRDEIQAICQTFIEADPSLENVLIPYHAGPLFFTLDENSLKNPQSVAAMHWRQKGAAVADIGDIKKLLSLVNRDNSQTQRVLNSFNTPQPIPMQPRGTLGARRTGDRNGLYEVVTISYCGSRNVTMSNIYANASEDISGTLEFSGDNLHYIPESVYDAWSSLEDDGHYSEVDYDSISYCTDDWEVADTEDYSDMVSGIYYNDRNGNRYNLGQLAPQTCLIEEVVMQIEEEITTEALSQERVERIIENLI